MKPNGKESWTWNVRSAKRASGSAFGQLKCRMQNGRMKNEESEMSFDL